MRKKIKIALLAILLLLTLFTRFYKLGYSNLYGDETKAINFRKNLSTKEFIVNQRKGPTQFLVTWATQKIFSNSNELIFRLPFAIANFLAVILLFLFINKLFGFNTAYISTWLFSLNGFSIAWGRTIQYQSFLLLFGFASIYLAINFSLKQKYIFMLGSSVFLALSVLTHYDAIFFIIPVIFLLLKNNFKNISAVRFLLLFVLPLFILTGIYYIPYIKSDFFADNVFIYLHQRARGYYLLPNNSLFTYFVYNPVKFTGLIFLFSIPAFINYRKTLPIIIWFLIPFVCFELIFSNPGTHIQNYVIPLFVLIGWGSNYLINNNKTPALVVLTFFILVYSMVNIFIFTPSKLNNYPWTDTSIFGFNLPKVPKNLYQIFIYGFPYNRGWDQIRKYVNSTDLPIIGGYNFSTNDNVTIGEYYLNPLFPYHGDCSLYYEVNDNQMDKIAKPNIKNELIYRKLKDVYVEDEIVGKFYIRII